MSGSVHAKCGCRYSESIEREAEADAEAELELRGGLWRFRGRAEAQYEISESRARGNGGAYSTLYPRLRDPTLAGLNAEAYGIGSQVSLSSPFDSACARALRNVMVVSVSMGWLKISPKVPR